MPFHSEDDESMHPENLPIKSMAAEVARQCEIIDAALTEIDLLLKENPASRAVKDYIWRAGDPKGRKTEPMPDFVLTGRPDAAELERLMIGVAGASNAWLEDKWPVVQFISRAFEMARC
jgi:hypothetical protein